MEKKETMGQLIFFGNMEPLIQRESYKQFQQNQTEPSPGISKGRVCAEVIKLRDLEREAVIQFFWENLPVEEIAKRMNLTKKSVQKLLELALNTIKARLTQPQSPKELVQE